jgi:hypothetical protein
MTVGVSPVPSPAAWRADLLWIRVWIRAVLMPASRRADAAWLGCGLVAAVLFGPTAMRPSDLTGLALHDPAVGIVLGATWLLVFLPTARLIVRPRAAYLHSLPGAPRAARMISALALIGLQLPWLVLWVLGEGALGAAIAGATTVVVAGLAAWQPPRPRVRLPAWRRPGQALRSIHLRALRRRAGDALIRGAGLSVLAGAAAGLLVRNNQLTGEPAGVLAASVIAIALVPAQAGTALVALGAHRETAWLADASGISRATRIAALAHAVACIHLAATAIAVAAAMGVAGADPWLPAVALPVAIGTALGETRALLAAETSPTAPMRVAIGAILSAALAVICLAVLDAAGAIAIAAIGASALLLVRP